jgi:hypothetical protein
MEFLMVNKRADEVSNDLRVFLPFADVTSALDLTLLQWSTARFIPDCELA